MPIPQPHGMSAVQHARAITDKPGLQRVKGWLKFRWETDRHHWTVYTKDASCGRGDYAEEFDVATEGRHESDVRRVVFAALINDYSADVRIARIVYRG